MTNEERKAAAVPASRLGGVKYLPTPDVRLYAAAPALLAAARMAVEFFRCFHVGDVTVVTQRQAEAWAALEVAIRQAEGCKKN